MDMIFNRTSRIALNLPSTGMDLTMFKIGLIDELLNNQDMSPSRKADLMRRRRHLYDEIDRYMECERKMRMAAQMASNRDTLDAIDRRTKRILRDWWLFGIVHFQLPHIVYAFAVIAAIAVALSK